MSARLHAEYRFTRHLGIGAALDAFKVNATAKQRDCAAASTTATGGRRPA